MAAVIGYIPDVPAREHRRNAGGSSRRPLIWHWPGGILAQREEP